MLTVWSQIIWQNIAYQCLQIWLKISYRKTNFLCANPLTVLRVFLDTSRCSAFTHVVFSWKKKIMTKLWGASFVGLWFGPLYRLFCPRKKPQKNAPQWKYAWTRMIIWWPGGFAKRGIQLYARMQFNRFKIAQSGQVWALLNWVFI